MKINISIFLFACVIPFVIFILPIIGYKELVYKLDSYSPFWVFSLQLGLGLLLFIKLFKDFATWIKETWKNNTKQSDSKPILIILLILIVGVQAISIAFIEPRSRIQADESIHYVIAQNLYHNQIGQICLEGSFMENSFACVLGQTVKTRGLSYIYMLGMPFFGTHLYWVHTLHLFFLALALLSFYLALLAWLKQHSIALLATALLASCPILLFCFRAASVEPLYVTMFCVSLLFLKWAYDRNTTRHWLLLALTLAFFAQTRTETVFCLFAFIAVVWWRTCYQPLATSHSLLAKFSTLNSFQFSAFLATLFFFSIPVLCTLSYMRDSDLQGGDLGAHGHLFSNIISNFKVMALPSTGNDGILQYPFLPYFTWLALFGLIALIILTVKEFKNKSLATSHLPLATFHSQLSTLNSQLSIPYKYIIAFLILLSPQYIILFNGISADLSMTVQWRFALVILPPMAFLGAFFLWKLSNLATLHSQLSTLNSQLLAKITLYGTTSIIFTTCLIQYKTFIQDIPNIRNFVTTEDYELNKWIKQNSSKRILFFYWYPLVPLAYGYSTYSYMALLNLNSEDLRDILEDYKGEVYFVNASSCDIIVGTAKMQSPNSFRLCDRSMRYFDTQEVYSMKILENFKPFSIHKILGFNDIDSLGLLRIMNKTESSDSTVEMHFNIPKKRIEPWKVLHFINDSLVGETPYEKKYYTNTYSFSFFNRDTNIWRLDVIDTITNEKIHSDFWELVKIKRE